MSKPRSLELIQGGLRLGHERSEPRSLEHEQDIADDPDDLSRYAVYADWLLERGNVRGEFAAIQLALAASERPDLRAREQQLLAQHPSLFHLGWIYRKFTMLEWRGGFLHRLGCEVHGPTLAEILMAPSARLLHTLHVVGVLDHPRRRGDLDQAVEAVAGAGLIGLRHLWLGAPPRHDGEWEHFERRPCPDLRRLSRSCPRLQTLVVMAPCFDIGDPSSPEVEFAELLEFDARMGSSSEAVASLASVSFPKLHTLHLGFASSSQADVEPTRWTLDPLLTGAATPALKRLILWETHEPSMDDTLLTHVRGSPLGQRLDQLELLSNRAPDSFEDPNGIFITPLHAT